MSERAAQVANSSVSFLCSGMNSFEEVNARFSERVIEFYSCLLLEENYDEKEEILLQQFYNGNAETQPIFSTIGPT